MRRRLISVLAVTFSACGARSGLESGWFDDSARGGTAGSGVTLPNGGHPNPTGGSGGNPSGGRPSLGGNGGRPSSGGQGGARGGVGGSGVADDPNTLGDERAGWVQCFNQRPPGGMNQTATVCGQGMSCCSDSARCLSSGAAPSCKGLLYQCDGDEDCPGGHCCRANNYVCGTTCSPQADYLLHLPCDGQCQDGDHDGIPDHRDQCLFSPEDGRGPFPNDGCPDTDADGIPNDRDQCLTQAEDGLPPSPMDGCPARIRDAGSD